MRTVVRRAGQETRDGKVARRADLEWIARGRTGRRNGMKTWDALYREQGVFQVEPARTALAAIAVFRARGVSRVLDLGCGTGRHSAALAAAGFEVYGCDSSATALRTAAGLLPGADFRPCDMTSLPYAADYFDAVLCHQVIQHGLWAQVEKAAAEIVRVLRPGGFLYLAAASSEHPQARSGREIEPGTRIGTTAPDGEVPHHFLKAEEIRRFFAGFRIESLEHVKGPSDIDPGKESAAWVLLAQKL